MKTTPYELVFGQPPRSVIAPDSTVGGIIDETVIQLDDGSSDDPHYGDGNGNQEDTPSRSRSDDVDNVIECQVSVFLQQIMTILSYMYCNLIG